MLSPSKPALDDLFKNVEMVLQAISISCIKLSVEFVAESMISKYNLHNNPLRSISEETAHDGPGIGESDALLSEALMRHFNPKGPHVVEENHMFLNEGKTVREILKRKSRLPFY